MSIIAELGMAPDEFVLGDALLLPAIDRVEFERVVPTRKSVMPFFWAWGSSFEGFEREAEKESAIAEVTTVDTFEDGRLYRAEWCERVPGFVRAIRENHALFQSGSGDVEGWNFELRFPDQESLIGFREFYEANDLEFSLQQLYRVKPPGNGDGYGLTPKQREILVAAVEEGYFDEPRNLALEDLASEIGISTPSASGRLRRATHRLVQSTLLED